MDIVTEKCDEFLDLVSDEFDYKTASGVLNVDFGTEVGVWVLNKQAPAQQLWLSSPISGPNHYDYDAEENIEVIRYSNEFLSAISPIPVFEVTDIELLEKTVLKLKTFDSFFSVNEIYVRSALVKMTACDISKNIMGGGFPENNGVLLCCLFYWLCSFDDILETARGRAENKGKSCEDIARNMITAIDSKDFVFDEQLHGIVFTDMEKTGLRAQGRLLGLVVDEVRSVSRANGIEDYQFNCFVQEIRAWLETCAWECVKYNEPVVAISLDEYLAIRPVAFAMGIYFEMALIFVGTNINLDQRKDKAYSELFKYSLDVLWLLNDLVGAVGDYKENNPFNICLVILKEDQEFLSMVSYIRNCVLQQYLEPALKKLEEAYKSCLCSDSVKIRSASMIVKHVSKCVYDWQLASARYKNKE